MATTFENIGISQIENAVNGLRSAYAAPGGAENRRDQLKHFMTAIYAGLETLGREADADIDVLVWDLDTIRQTFDCAFVDAVKAEENAEPRIDPVRQWGTYNTMSGRVA